MLLAPALPEDLAALRAFLSEADLTLAGLEDHSVRLWIDRREDGTICGSTGFELSGDGAHALIRSVAVSADRRRTGAGTSLARYALRAAAESGATDAWLFSRRSGTFWQTLGFTPADRAALTEALPGAHQVALFARTGQLENEVAWRRSLRDPLVVEPESPPPAEDGCS
ncbi:MULTISPECIES: GNAT family N-acetyltransferase [unclassified Rathayibacter]|uniref:GNAT family N-acetyltransferase n=1 Tax=unclassified Rathayibacter TaxID=2609250 RepID=UPI001FB47C72|nr:MULTISPECIES: GNAT family N-acetyltransferase [unclassified Rathayibacter]MCJ1675339.1 GNAT family N-acetyltransferase [Rathayibacter sp. VKM Ac-2929]MCJ1684312.1 GNAT family N-acetyltransferase [Rathayibacter sp. VKM Ac-2928]